jgi:hypothetical protein
MKLTLEPYEFATGDHNSHVLTVEGVPNNPNDVIVGPLDELEVMHDLAIATNIPPSL